MNPLTFPAMGQIVLLLFFLKDGDGIIQPKKVDMPLNKQTVMQYQEFLSNINWYKIPFLVFISI